MNLPDRRPDSERAAHDREFRAWLKKAAHEYLITTGRRMVLRPIDTERLRALHSRHTPEDAVKIFVTQEH